MHVGPVGKMASGVPQFSLVARIAPPVSTVTLYCETIWSNGLQVFRSHLG